MENAEINNLIKIVGLQYKHKYDSEDSLKSLRYGKIMIMADQDQDGSHIKGLMINFIHHNWPNLLKHNFVEEFITPIVKVSRVYLISQQRIIYSVQPFIIWVAAHLEIREKSENTWNSRGKVREIHKKSGENKNLFCKGIKNVDITHFISIFCQRIRVTNVTYCCTVMESGIKLVSQGK